MAACSRGVTADFGGPDDVPELGLTWAHWNEIVRLFPMDRFVEETKKALCGFCRTKPGTTYDNALVSVGERWVDGYNVRGKT